MKTYKHIQINSLSFNIQRTLLRLCLLVVLLLIGFKDVNGQSCDCKKPTGAVDTPYNTPQQPYTADFDITCPYTVSVQCASAVPAKDPASVTVISKSACFVPTVTCLGDVISDSTCPNRFTITRTYQAKNKFFTKTCTQMIYVYDNLYPTITAPAALSVTTDAGDCTATIATLGTPSATDNCGVDSITNDHPSTTYPLGTTTVTWTVTDSCGNTATATQVVTVTDNEPPTITVPADVTATTDGGLCTASGVSLGTPTTADNCTVASVTNDHVSTTYPLGSTTVTWMVTDGSGNTATATQLVTVTDNENPTITPPADVTATANAAGCTATGVSLGTPSTGDNCSVASVTNNHVSTTYSLGTTTVTWTVSDGSGNTATATQVVTVTNSLTGITVSATPNPVCSGLSTALTASGEATYMWAPSAGLSATTGTGITASPSVTTTYTVTGTNAAGCNNSAAKTVTVNPLPYAGTISGAASILVGAATTFTDAAPGGVWSSGNPAIATIGSTGIVTGIAVGTVTITYTVTNSCGTDFAIKPLIISCSTTITGTTVICAGSSVTLSASTGGGTWSSSNTSVATVGSAGVVLGVNAGFATITYALSSECRATTTVTVYAPPTANAGSNQTICATTTAVTLAGSRGGGASSATWTTSGSGTFAPNAYTLGAVYVPSSGDKTSGHVVLTLTARASSGPCAAATGTKDLYIRTAATVIVAASPQTVCAGGTVTLAGSYGGGATSATWSASSGTFSSPATPGGSTYTPSITSGIVSLYLTARPPAGSPCGGVSGIIDIMVNPAATVNAGPDQTVCACADVTLAGSVGGSATSGTWSGGAGLFSPSATTLGGFYAPTTTEVATGLTLTLTTNDPVGPCGTATGTMHITWTHCGARNSGNPMDSVTGIPAESIKIYPNPVSSILYIEAPVKVLVSVISIDGKKLIDQTEAISINVAGLPDGMYMILVYDENKMLLKKERFVKLK